MRRGRAWAVGVALCFSSERGSAQVQIPDVDAETERAYTGPHADYARLRPYRSYLRLARVTRYAHVFSVFDISQGWSVALARGTNGKARLLATVPLPIDILFNDERAEPPTPAKQPLDVEFHGPDDLRALALELPALLGISSGRVQVRHDRSAREVELEEVVAVDTPRSARARMGFRRTSRFFTDDAVTELEVAESQPPAKWYATPSHRGGVLDDGRAHALCPHAAIPAPNRPELCTSPPRWVPLLAPAADEGSLLQAITDGEARPGLLDALRAAIRAAERHQALPLAPLHGGVPRTLHPDLDQRLRVSVGDRHVDLQTRALVSSSTPATLTGEHRTYTVVSRSTAPPGIAGWWPLAIEVRPADADDATLIFDANVYLEGENALLVGEIRPRTPASSPRVTPLLRGEPVRFSPSGF